MIRGSRQRGFTMIEVLVSLLIIVLGLLGLAGMQARMQAAEFESYQRTQALILLYDIVDRINVNRETGSCFAVTTSAATGEPYVGPADDPNSVNNIACAAALAAQNAMADAAFAEWRDALRGAAETKGGLSVGAMIGARGCVNYNAASEILDPASGIAQPGTGIYTVSVAWQGTVETSAPKNADGTTINCANGQYGPETRRRAVSTTFRLAKLN